METVVTVVSQFVLGTMCNPFDIPLLILVLAHKMYERNQS